MNRILINSKDLLKAAESVGSLIKGNHINPICNNLLFECKNEIVIIADNLEIRSEITVEYPDEKDIKTCFDCVMFLSVLKNLPSEPINLIFEEKQLIIKSSSGEYKLPLIDPEPFPSPVLYPEYGKAKVNGIDFADGLKKATRFLPEMDVFDKITDGVCVSIGESCGVYSGGRWQTYFRGVEGSGDQRDITISRTAAHYIASVCDEEVILEYHEDKTFCVKTGNHKIDVRPSEGNYPVVMLKKSNASVEYTEDYGYEYNSEQLKNTLTRICKIGGDSYISILKMEFAGGKLKMIAHNDFVSSSFTEVIPFKVPEDFEVGYAIKGLKTMLSAMPEDFKFYIKERKIIAGGAEQSSFALFMYTEDTKIVMSNMDYK